MLPPGLQPEPLHVVVQKRHPTYLQITVPSLNMGRMHARRLLLESNTERERAHKFYVNQGLTKTAYRFAKDL